MSDMIWLPEVDSTNRYAMRHFEALPDGALIAAGCQTAGSGRMGRTWNSPPMENIYASFVMKRIRQPAGNASIIAPLGTLRMLRQAAPNVKFWIKWPNDIYCGLKKIAGVLCEGRLSGPDFSGIVAGIGVNINMPQAVLETIDQPATSLAVETGGNLNLHLQLERLATALQEYYTAYSAAPQTVFAQWKQENLLIGKTVEIVNAQHNCVRGKIMDIGESGELLFATAGQTLKFYSGDIRITKTSLSNAVSTSGQADIAARN